MGGEDDLPLVPERGAGRRHQQRQQAALPLQIPAADSAHIQHQVRQATQPIQNTKKNIFSEESEAPTAGLLAADTFFAFPSNLSQILEEEERQSSRNSLEKERDGEPEASAAARVGDAESTKVDVNDNNNIDSDIESISIHELPKSDQDKKNIVNESPASSSDEKKTNKRKISRT